MRLRAGLRVLRRTATEVQVGTDPRWAVRLPDLTPAEADLLQSVDARTDLTEVARLVAGRDVDPDRVRALVDVLVEARLTAGRPVPGRPARAGGGGRRGVVPAARRRGRCRRRPGPRGPGGGGPRAGPDRARHRRRARRGGGGHAAGGRRTARALDRRRRLRVPVGRRRLGARARDGPAAAGRRPARRRPRRTGHRTSWSSSRTGWRTPGAARSSSPAGIAHLGVVVREADTVVGPFVVPGAGPCLRCLDLHRSGRGRVVAHDRRAAARRRGRRRVRARSPRSAPGSAPRPCSRTSTGVPGLAPGATFEVALPDAVPRRRTWAVHPECGCTALPASLVGAPGR